MANQKGNQVFSTTDMWNMAFQLGKVYYQGTETIRSNRTDALLLFRFGIDYAYSGGFFSGDPYKDKPKEVQYVKDIIESQPKIDLQKAVEKQISAEKDKNPDGFFVVKDILRMCDDDSEDGGHDWKNCSSTFLSPYYEESVRNAIKSIVALSLATDSQDIETIQNTFYYIAIYKGNDPVYREELQQESAVYNRLWDESLHQETGYNGNQLFHIWYLRQIPYAAKDVFKKLKTDKSWDEYIDEAEAYIQQNEQLRTAFGYDPARAVQKLTLLE